MTNEAIEAAEWECFSDPAYYDMWCVRQVGSRTFGEGFHLVNGDEAKGLCELLNARQAAYAAGLERAAVILEQRAAMYHGKAAKSNPLAEDSMNLHDGFRLCAEASEFAAGDIRAEKDKL